MVDLSQIELASEEDKAYEIDRWARLFKARTWEELRMIAKNDPNLQQASTDLYVITADQIMRQQARARADAEFWERHTKAQLQRLEEELQEKDEALQEKDRTSDEQKVLIAQLQAQLAEKERK